MESSSSWVRGRTIGAGSFGAVHLAMDKCTGFVFAVKSVGLSWSSPASIQSLENEIQILESLRSPYVVTYLGDDTSHEPRAGTCRNLHLEYMPGGTAADAAAAAPAAKGCSMDELQVRAYTRCVARALRYLHDVAGVVHCDVKGRNVLLSRDRLVAKLADFGAAVRIADVRADGGGRNWVRGSPLWMAPEVARGEPPTPGSDVWSLGCTVIEMVAGAQPWSNMETKDAAGALLQIAYSDEVPEFPARLSNTGRDFLDKCLRRTASKRWTVEQLLQHPFLAEEGVVAEPSPRGVLEWAYMESHDEQDDDCAEDRCNANCCCDHGGEEVMACARERIKELASDGGGLGWCADGWELVRCSEEANSVADMEEEEEIVVVGMCQELGGWDGSLGELSGVGLCRGIRCSASCCCCCCYCCHCWCWSCCCCFCGLGCQHGFGIRQNSVFFWYHLLSQLVKVDPMPNFSTFCCCFLLPRCFLVCTGYRPIQEKYSRCSLAGSLVLPSTH